MRTSNKYCTCQEPGVPTNLPMDPKKYEGSAVCSKCQGIIEFPLSSKNIKRTGDAAKDFLAVLDKNTDELTFEKAVLSVLLDIRDALADKKKVGK